MAHLSATRCTLTSVIARTPKCNTIRRYASSWYYNPTELSSNTTNTSGTWYNPTPSPPPAPPQRENINKEKVFIPPRAVRKETSTNPPRLEHCPGYYSFFRDLEHGFKHIPWPKKEDTHFHPDWMNGFKVIENYISQKEHDTFLAEVLEYSRKSHKVTHFDGRLVMNEMDTPFYHLFFNRLIDDGILEGPDRLAPNIYANGDGIPPHFDSIPPSPLLSLFIFFYSSLLSTRWSAILAPSLPPPPTPPPRSYFLSLLSLLRSGSP